MPQRRLLLLDSSRLIAFQWTAGTLTTEAEFSAEGDGVAAFSQYLAETKNSLFYLVVDISDESFQIEDIPYVHGGDRTALIRRRLSQYFYTTPYVAAISFGRARSGRRDEKMLFAGITGTLHLEPWMTALREAAVQLVGLYSVPLLVAAFQANQKPPAKRQLVITVGVAGIRQTYFENGQFRLSRLTPLPSANEKECATVCLSEAQKIYQYLISQRILERGSRLSVRVLAGEAQTAAIRGRISALDEFEFKFELIDELTRKAGLKAYPANLQADALLLQLAVSQTPSVQFAPDADRHRYRLWQIRSAINAVGILGFAACLLLAAKLSLDVFMSHQHTVEIQEHTRADNARYESMMATLPPLPVKVEELKLIIGRYDDLKRKSPTLRAGLVRISQAMEAVPGVELTSLDWTLSSNPEDSAAPANQPGTSSGLQYVVIKLNANLPLSMINDHRGMIDTVDSFVRALKTAPDVDVKMTKQPFETESGKTIKSGREGSNTQIDPPSFSVRIAQRIP